MNTLGHQNLHVSSSSMDGLVWKMKGKFKCLRKKALDGPVAFIKEYKDAMKGDPSYFEAEQISPKYSLAYDRAAQAFADGWDVNPLVSRLHQSKNGPVELGKMRGRC